MFVFEETAKHLVCALLVEGENMGNSGRSRQRGKGRCREAGKGQGKSRGSWEQGKQQGALRQGRRAVEHWERWSKSKSTSTDRGEGKGR